jgi:hypothetical protein
MIPNGLDEIIAGFGNPSKNRSKWERANIVRVPLPFHMTLAWCPGAVIDTVRLHKEVAKDFEHRMEAVWAHAREAIKKREGYGHTTQFYDSAAAKWLNDRGLTIYGGGFNYRKKRSNGKDLSVHSWGAAFDIDPTHNAQGTVGRMPDWYVEIWTTPDAEGNHWVWGGKFAHKDYMHFQFCSGY